MQVRKIQQQNTQNQQNPQFKGADALFNAATSTCRYLATNQAVGANSVDLGSMGIPRTITDAVNRGPQVAWETGPREFSGTLNDSAVGLYGAGVGACLASVMGMNKKYGITIEKTTKNGKTRKVKIIDMNRLLTAPETFDIFAENKTRQIKNKKSQLDYIKDSLEHIKVYNPEHERADAEGYVKFSKKTIKEFAKILNESINDTTLEYPAWSSSATPNSRPVLLNMLTEDVGAQAKCVIESAETKGLKSITDLSRVVGDLYITSKAFNTEKAKEAFKEQIKKGLGIEGNTFRNDYVKYMKAKSLTGVAIGAIIGASVQPINMYITKKRTGCDGFVGGESSEKDNSIGFKLLKLGVGLAALTAIVADMGCHFGKNLSKELIGKTAFKGYWPSMDQIKCLFGITIFSRILSARSKDELRESVTKDGLSYIGWLILGALVNNVVAESMDSSVMRRTKETAQKGFFKRAFTSKLKTRDEVLINALKKAGIDTTTNEGGKLKALGFKEMLKKLEKEAPEAIKKATKKQLRTLNIAQLSGYLFSGVVLGFAVPKLNGWLTKTLEAKRKAKQNQQDEQAQQVKQEEQAKLQKTVA